MVGAIEINLLTHLPLLDPVEKNRLKKLYNTEDQTHLQQLLAAFECMQITMNYGDLGREYAAPFGTKLAALREQTHAQIVPLRPTECTYSHLVKDITHFLQTCCQPRALLDLFAAAEANLGRTDCSTSCAEAIKRIELWINNSCQFQHHTLAKYEPFYMDFLVPIRNSIVMLTHGLRGLKHCLQQVCIVPGGSADELALNAMLGNLVEYPTIGGLHILPTATTSAPPSEAVSIGRVLAKSNDFDAHYLKLLKVKLREMENNIALAGTISEANVGCLNHLLGLFNGVWKKQEDLRRQRVAEDESLYVTK